MRLSFFGKHLESPDRRPGPTCHLLFHLALSSSSIWALSVYLRISPCACRLSISRSSVRQSRGEIMVEQERRANALTSHTGGCRPKTKNIAASVAERRHRRGRNRWRLRSLGLPKAQGTHSQFLSSRAGSLW